MTPALARKHIRLAKNGHTFCLVGCDKADRVHLRYQQEAYCIVIRRHGQVLKVVTTQSKRRATSRLQEVAR
jgi:hypothetical protein